jgi:hypothetical protein
VIATALIREMTSTTLSTGPASYIISFSLSTFQRLHVFIMSTADEINPANAGDATSKADSQVTAEPAIPEGPTDSHVLSQVEQDEKGLAQKAGDTEGITNIGWGVSPNVIEEPLVAGLSNEDLWMLIRRFDKVRSSTIVSCFVFRTKIGILSFLASLQSQSCA